MNEFLRFAIQGILLLVALLALLDFSRRRGYARSGFSAVPNEFAARNHAEETSSAGEERFRALIEDVGRLARLPIVGIENTPIHDIGDGLICCGFQGGLEQVCQLRVNELHHAVITQTDARGSPNLAE